LLRQDPVQAESREHLKQLLDRASGGVFFTTIHKFTESLEKDPEKRAISRRANIVVMADEAHRSQYGFVDGGARWMREALANAIFHGTLELPPPSFDMDDEVAERVRAELASRRGREPYASRRVTLYVVESDAAVTLVVEDEGPGYDPSAIPDPTESTSLRATGRGIFLMRELMDDLRFEDEGRRVTLVKRRGPA